MIMIMECMLLMIRLYLREGRAAKKLYFEKQFTKFEHDIKNTWSVIKDLLGIKKQKDHMDERIDLQTNCPTDEQIHRLRDRQTDEHSILQSRVHAPKNVVGVV